MTSPREPATSVAALAALEHLIGAAQLVLDQRQDEIVWGVHSRMTKRVPAAALEALQVLVKQARGVRLSVPAAPRTERMDLHDELDRRFPTIDAFKDFVAVRGVPAAPGEGAAMSLTVEQLAKLSPDVIAQVVNAYRDAWEAVGSEGKAPNVMRAHEAAAQAFRDALTSVLPRLGDAPQGSSADEVNTLSLAISGLLGEKELLGRAPTELEVWTLLSGLLKVGVRVGVASRDAPPEPPKCDRCGKELGKDTDAYCRGHGEPPQPYFDDDDIPHRWNVEQVEGGVRICMGLHERSAPCEWVFHALYGAASRARAPGEELTHHAKVDYETGRDVLDAPSEPRAPGAPPEQVPWEFADLAEETAIGFRKHFARIGGIPDTLRLTPAHWRLIVLALERAASSDDRALRDFAARRANYHATYNGGWHGNADTLRAFHHGMDTVFNGLDDALARAAPSAPPPQETRGEICGALNRHGTTACVLAPGHGGLHCGAPLWEQNYESSDDPGAMERDKGNDG